MKRILYVDDGSMINLLRGKQVGGGTMSNFQLLASLPDEFSVDIVTPGIRGNYPVLAKYDNLDIVPLELRLSHTGIINNFIVKKKYPEKIGTYLDNNNVDIVICTTKLICPVVRIAKRKGAAAVCLIREYENLYIVRHKKGFLNKAETLLGKFCRKKKELRSMKTANLVVTNSRFMQKKFDEEYGVRSCIVYPPVNIQLYKTESSETTTGIKNRIGVINPVKKKGYKIVLNIARKLKDRYFVYYGAKPSDHRGVEKKYGNISFAGWTNSANIYKDVDLVLVPSLFEEPFGRVPVESIASGKWVIVSGKGGLAEAVDYDRRMIVDDPYDIDEWVCRIREYYADYEFFNDAAVQKSADIEKYSIERQAEVFKNLLYSCLP